eukprot:918901_1
MTMTRQTAILILAAVFALQLMAGCEAGRFGKIDWKKHATDLGVELEDHKNSHEVVDVVDEVIESKPYCCRQYNPIADVEGLAEIANKLFANYVLDKGFSADTNETVQLSSRVGVCGDAVEFNDGEQSVKCVPLCCDCCHELAVVDRHASDTTTLESHSDLNLCCTGESGCYLQNGGSGQLRGSSTPDFTAALETVWEGLTTLAQEVCGDLTGMEAIITDDCKTAFTAFYQGADYQNAIADLKTSECDNIAADGMYHCCNSRFGVLFAALQYCRNATHPIPGMPWRDWRCD